MISQRQLFLQHVGQTSDFPMMLEIEKAKGIYLYDIKGKKYIDLISGVSVSNVGHCNPKVVRAVEDQVEKYMHLMVYGEYIECPQVQYAKLLTEQLPPSLDSVYFVNSGTEANEGALKLAKRYTGRSGIVAFKNAYHGSTHGSLSVMGNEYFKNAYRPLLPDVSFIEFNNPADLERITKQTACVIIEPVLGEGGLIVPKDHFLGQLRERCNETGTLLIFDEVKTGFGRTGSLFAFQEFNVVPDIMTLAKAMGGGMPIGAFVASNRIMSSLKTNPILGHITTFGGHPVCCAAALASLQYILDNHLVETVKQKGELFKKLLKHPQIKEVRGIGLFMAVQLENPEAINKVLPAALQKGIILDRFLFCDSAFSIAPPLIITEEEIKTACNLLLSAIDEALR